MDKELAGAPVDAADDDDLLQVFRVFGSSKEVSKLENPDSATELLALKWPADDQSLVRSAFGRTLKSQ